MTAVYGYLSADYPLADDCRNNTTIAYYMRCSDYKRVTENRYAGSIRIRSDKKAFTFESDIRQRESMEFGVSSEEGKHINVFTRFIKSLDEGSLILFTSIKDISSDCQAALYLYRMMIDRGISVEFLEQPWLNSKHYTMSRKEYSGTDLVIQNVLQATYDNLDRNSNYLAVLSRTESNKAKKNEL